MNRIARIGLVLCCLLAAEAFAGWTEPVNMGPKVNSDVYDLFPCISSDGKFFFLTRNGSAGTDLYFCEMTDTGWTNARPMPNPINSYRGDEVPFFTRGGTRLYFASDRVGGMGWFDIWFADYDTLTGEWGEPAVCDTPLNSGNSENAASLRGDNEKIYLNRGGQLGPLTVATWRGENWGDLKRLNSLIETGDENYPSISTDGQTIYFTRYLLHIGTQIFYSTKYDTCDDCWNTPIRLPGIINNPWASEPFISHDGTRLYFTSERPGGFGGVDIYYSEYILDIDDSVRDLPVSLGLQAYPNPFNSIVTISFSLPRVAGGNVALTVYDVRGALVRRLFLSDEAWGYQEVTWDGRSGQGQQVGSGIYFCVLSWRGETLNSAKITLLK